ncbi:MAG: type I-E CRISPR-associated protein Cse2/CasB [Acidobacteria bacterium]|nr:type I-E CRISPR-associated protein Cse2/CasB [Acidobacteriota bacterium]
MTSPVKEKTSGEKLREEFIEALEKLYEKDDRAALATLRRGLGKKPGEEMGIYRYLGRFANRMKRYQQEEAYHLVATLFGLYPSPSWSSGDNNEKTNLGASFKRLQAEMGGDGVERRFTALLNAHSEDLSEHLRQAVGLLKSKEISIDWVQLLRAVEFWDFDDDRRTQRAWAKAFWKE